MVMFWNSMTVKIRIFWRGKFFRPKKYVIRALTLTTSRHLAPFRIDACYCSASFCLIANLAWNSGTSWTATCSMLAKCTVHRKVKLVGAASNCQMKNTYCLYPIFTLVCSRADLDIKRDIATRELFSYNIRHFSNSSILHRNALAAYV